MRGRGKGRENCERVIEREKERGGGSVCMCARACVRVRVRACVCVCVRVRKRERKEMRRTRSSRNVNYIARKCNYYNELLNKEITTLVSALSRKHA